jgi:hypothetical protein
MFQFEVEDDQDLLLRYELSLLNSPKQSSSFFDPLNRDDYNLRKYDEPNEYSMFHFDFNKFLLWLNLFNMIRGENDGNSFSENLWWICIVFVSVIVGTMLIIRIWLCCDPNCERTKEKLKEFKKKIISCCPCCENNEEFINSINNNIESDTYGPNYTGAFEISQELIDNSRAMLGKKVEKSVDVDENVGIASSATILPNNEITIRKSSTEIEIKNKENDTVSNDKFVYFPASVSSENPSHVFVNIMQPTKPLCFIPVDIILPILMPFEKPEIIFEKFVFNVEEETIHKLFYLETESKDKSSLLVKAEVINPAMIKLHFILFIQRLISLQFPSYKQIPTFPENKHISPLLKEQFFDPGEFNVLVIFVRVKIDNDTFMEIYDLENLIRLTNVFDNGFISGWSKCFPHLQLLNSNKKIMCIKSLENSSEFNYVKIIKKANDIYIDNIILELRMLQHGCFTQEAIKDFDYASFNVVSVIEKVDTSLIKINEVEEDSNSVNVFPTLSPSLSSSESPHECEVQSIPISDNYDISRMVRNIANRSIQINRSRRCSSNSINHDISDNSSLISGTFRSSAVITPFTLIADSKTQELNVLIKEITWLEVCNTIVAVALILIAVSLAFLFFDPHFIKSKNKLFSF